MTVNGVDPSVYFQKLNAFFSSGTAPDIIQVAADYGNEYTAKGVFAPLDAYLTDDLKGEWAESLLDALKTDGVQYAIPIGVQVSFIAYNKALFDEAGLPYPTKDWTEAEFLETVKNLTAPEKNQYGILVSGSANETIRNMYGDYCYDWDTNTMTATDNPSFKHAVELFYNLFVTDKATPAATSTKDIGGGFETGKYPMAIIHYWDIASLSSTIGDSFDWDIVQFPMNEEYGVRWQSPLYVQAMSIANTSEHKEEAFEFIKWWATNAAPQTSMADSFPASTAIQSSADYLASSRTVIRTTSRWSSIPSPSRVLRGGTAGSSRRSTTTSSSRRSKSCSFRRSRSAWTRRLKPSRRRASSSLTWTSDSSQRNVRAKPGSDPRLRPYYGRFQP